MKESRTVRRIVENPFTGCVVKKGRGQKCFRLCSPAGGVGKCGRLAPHGMRSHFQVAIDQYKIHHS